VYKPLFLLLSVFVSLAFVLNGTGKHFIDHVFVSSVPGSDAVLYAAHYTHGEIAVWSNSRLENVRLTEVRIGSEGDDMYLYLGETLSNPVMEMEPYTLFQINVSHFVGSTIPSTALSITDPNGHLHHFLLAISGYDGSVGLFPYPLAEIGEQQPTELYASYKNTYVLEEAK